jgi:hypothetical protein
MSRKELVELLDEVDDDGSGEVRWGELAGCCRLLGGLSLRPLSA